MIRDSFAVLAPQCAGRCYLCRQELLLLLLFLFWWREMLAEAINPNRVNFLFHSVASHMTTLNSLFIDDHQRIRAGFFLSFCWISLYISVGVINPIHIFWQTKKTTLSYCFRRFAEIAIVCLVQHGDDYGERHSATRSQEFCVYAMCQDTKIKSLHEYIDT